MTTRALGSDLSPHNARSDVGLGFQSQSDTVAGSSIRPQDSDTEPDPHGPPRLAPVERPRGVFMRLLYWSARRRYGKTPTAFRVIYARAPALLIVTMAALTVLERFLRVPARVRALVQFAIATAHGCTFCADISLAEAMRSRVGAERFKHLDEFETHPAFDEAERAAIAYAKALARDRVVPAHLFERLAQSYSEREIVEIVWLGGLESYFNAMAMPLSIGSDHLAAAQQNS